jgi:glycosyltransferase involved in cell wall biosynthesis
MGIAVNEAGIQGDVEVDAFEAISMDRSDTGEQISRPLEAADSIAQDPLRIAMISTPFLSVPPKNYGGTELAVHELTEGLIAAGHQVVLFATGDSNTSAELRSLYPRGQWPPTALDEQNHVSWAMQQVLEGNFDLIHAHSPCALAFGRLLSDVPLVYTLHHLPLPELSGFYQGFPDASYIAISRRQRELEVPLPRCEVIHHGLDSRRFQCTDDPDDFVCFIGRYSECKGPHLAIDAARLAGLRIKIAGEVHEPDRAFAAAELTARLQQPHVNELGCIGIDEKVPLLRDARALLTPINWEEPFGLIIIEAMLSGCPVISFPRGSAPELVENGVTGYLVEDVEQMADVIRPDGVLDHFDRRRCQRLARERFSRERMVADHLELYRAAINKRAPGICRAVA